jgi:hypothetical protein
VSFEVVLHRLHSHPLEHLVEDLFKEVIQSRCLSEDLEQELEEDASLRILNSHIALGAEHRLSSHLDKHD